MGENIFCFYAKLKNQNAKFSAEAPYTLANIYVSAIVDRINLAIYCWENSRRSTYMLLSFGNLFILTFQACSPANLLQNDLKNFRFFMRTF